METMLDENVRQQVEKFFEALDQDVKILLFGSDDPQVCAYCSDTRQLLEEVCGLSAKTTVETLNLEENRELASGYHIESAPTFVILGKDGDQLVDFGVRYMGIPAGHEFTSLVNSILLVSKRDSGLTQETRDTLKALQHPVHLQVFVTPTCPYCPRAVVLAHQMAIESPMVQAEMVEATEFPELSNQFNVSGVPQTTINQGAYNVVGAAAESQLLAHIQKVLANN